MSLAEQLDELESVMSDYALQHGGKLPSVERMQIAAIMELTSEVKILSETLDNASDDMDSRLEYIRSAISVRAG